MLSTEQSAYIAGFLDGDGSINVKIERRPAHTSTGFVLKPRLSFTQHTRNRVVLDTIRQWIGSGSVADYPSKQLSELVIRDKTSILATIEQILPYLIVKEKVATLMLSFLRIPMKRGMRRMELFRKRYKIAVQIRSRNLTPKKYLRITALDPVTTDPERER